VPASAVSWIDLGVLGTYVLIMLGIGYYVYRRAPSFDEYLLAGRMMTTPILVCTLASTYYGLDILFGTSELAFNDGVVAFFAYSELSLGIYLFAAFALSTRLRSASFRSLPEILERNYGRSAGVYGALASIIYSVPSISLFALGRVCHVVFGLEPWIGALLLGGVALLYTLMGGLWAVAITDTIQFVLMCLTIAIAIPLLMGEVGGFEAVAASAPDGYFAPLGGMPIWLMIAYTAAGLSILVDPGFYQRVFAAKSARQARNGMLISLFVWFLYDWMVTAGGMLARAAISAGMLPADLHSNDALLAAVSVALPVGLTGIFLAGVLATAMSTIDSYTLVAGANVSYDLYRPLLKPAASDRELVRVTKLGIVASWILGYAIAFVFSKVMALLVFMTTLLTSMVLVPIFVSLYWKGRKTPLAGTLSCAVGLVSVIVYYLGIQELGVANEIYGTYIWTFQIAGTSISLWQEYSLFFTLPMSFVGFLIGSWIGREAPPPAATEGAK
jgi:SSS family solute:Na+ symporter